MTKNRSRRPRASTGFSLIEVMISLVITSIGLLGLAGLILNGLRTSTSAAHRTVAVELAHEMAERMRANRDGVAAGAYNSLTAAVADPGCIASNCTPAQLAVYDYWLLRAGAASRMPTGSITVTASGAGFLVRVFWDDDRTGATGTGCTSAAGDLKCFSLTVRPI